MSELLLQAAHAGLIVSQVAPRAAWLLAARGQLPLSGHPSALHDAATTPAPAATPLAATLPAATPFPVVPSQNLTPPLNTATSTNPTTTTTPTTTEFPTLLLTAIIWTSAAIALIILLLPDRTAEQRGRIRVMALVGAGLPLLLTLIGLNYQINQGLLGGGTSFEERHQWIHAFNVNVDYHLAVDGISLPLLALSTILFIVAVFASWHVERRIKLYFFLLLILETGVNGTFCAYDYVVFFLFYEIELIPMFLLIAVWGGANRMRAAWKFLGFTICSSALLLVAILLIGFKAGQGSFEFLQDSGPAGAGVLLTPGIASLCFWLTFAAFAIKLPVVPVHTWLPDAHTEASVPISVILAGILLKLGGYGMIRICLGAFPTSAHQFSTVIAVLAAVSAVWGTLAALAQDDLKRLVAYGSVGHMAIVLLAVSAQSSIALNGAVLQMVAHGLITGMLFLLVGTVQDRARTRSIRRLGGLAWQMPKLTALWVFAGLASLGLPFLAGFIAEFEVFTGAYPAHRMATVVVMVSVAITTGYLLWMLQRVFFGPSKEAFARLKDATALELIYLLPLVFFVVVFGVLPGRIIPLINNGVITITTRLTGS